MTCQVPETLACGYAGLSCSAATRALMRANVPFIEVTKYRKPCRTYLVADCVDYKIRRENAWKFPPK